MKRLLVFVFVFFPFLSLFSGTVRAESSSNSSAAVVAPFNSSTATTSDKHEDPNKWKHQFLFIMGVILLVAIFATASLGMAMAMHGKQVFVAHMIFAGITVFLAVAHAVTSVVWFSPF